MVQLWFQCFFVQDSVYLTTLVKVSRWWNKGSFSGQLEELQSWWSSKWCFECRKCFLHTIISIISTYHLLICKHYTLISQIIQPTMPHLYQACELVFDLLTMWKPITFRLPYPVWLRNRAVFTAGLSHQNRTGTAAMASTAAGAPRFERTSVERVESPMAESPPRVTWFVVVVVVVGQEVQFNTLSGSSFKLWNCLGM